MAAAMRQLLATLRVPSLWKPQRSLRLCVGGSGGNVVGGVLHCAQRSTLPVAAAGAGVAAATATANAVRCFTSATSDPPSDADRAERKLGSEGAVPSVGAFTSRSPQFTTRAPNEDLVAKGVLRRRETPLLFVHDLFHGAWCWEDHVLPYFAGHGYASHALQLNFHRKPRTRRGRQHAAPDEVPQEDGLVEASFEELLGSLGKLVRRQPSPPVLVGHGFGGYLVQKFLENHSEAAVGVVLMGTFPPAIGTGDELRARVNRFGEVEDRLQAAELEGVGVDDALKELAGVMCSNPHDGALEALASQPWFGKYAERLEGDVPEEAMRMMEENPCALPNHRPPMLLLGAEDDGLVSPEELFDTAEYYSLGSDEAKILAGGSHALMMGEHWRPCSEAMLEWMGNYNIN